MTADEQALLAAIVADPDDDTPRLVYADWLDENGRPERAEFIRLDCWLSQTKTVKDLKRSCKQEREELAARRDQLLKAYATRWRAELPAYAGLRWGPFARGMVESLVVKIAATYSLPDGVADVTPLKCVQLNYSKDFELRHGLAWTCLPRVQTLALQPGPRCASSNATRILVDHQWASQPVWLDLSQVWLRDSDAVCLLDMPTGKCFPRLIVRHSYISNELHDKLLDRFNWESRN
jgi:uncharacterized protein (TIGR02996 family)